MATKLETLLDAQAGKGCLGKAADDEPVFVLRAQDLLAPGLVEMWAIRAKKHGSEKKASGAYAIADAMLKWQASHPSKMPD